jgi:RNA polymerase sigma-70 factor (ECF subfamily)
MAEEDRSRRRVVGRAATAAAVSVSSARLLERARSGDRQAMDVLLTRCLVLVQRWATGRLPHWARDLSDTADLVQETVVQTLKHLGTFEPRGDAALEAYLRQALHNRICSEYRRAGRRPPRVPLEDVLLHPGPSPLEVVVGAETYQQYEAALARLAPDDRKAVVGRVELRCSYQELAHLLGKPSPDAARMAVARALVRLAQEMGRA